jgi:23S rRNA pseudouridine1911/1915/1917 synthase
MHELTENTRARDLKERVLLMTGDLIAVNKIAGEVMEGAGEGMVDLPSALASIAGGAERRLAPIHRLDAPVSGCALFARTREAAALLSAAFAGRMRDGAAPVEKTYWAIVEEPENPAFPAESGELVHWIEPGAGNRSVARRSKTPRSKRAVLRYRLIGRGERYLFLEIALLTGKHHQIRAQLAAEGVHIKGDLKYGARRSEKAGGIRLHARSLVFPDPACPSQSIRITADPPVMDALWRAFAGI